MSMTRASWGFQPPSEPAQVQPIHWRDQAAGIVAQAGLPRLAYGSGRSYGDVCLNNGGTLILTASLNRIIAYDRENGLLTAEAGVTFADILRLIVRDAWFTPVTPGTRFLSLGGAVANDVHGKEHVSQGTFGRHVTEFILWRSQGGRLVCRPDENGELFRATIGGLGLTGLITQVTFRLARIPGAVVDVTHGVGDSVAEIATPDAAHPFTVAWLDALAPDSEMGRGIITRGRFAVGDELAPQRELSVPSIGIPSSLMNNAVINAMNRLRWRSAVRRPRRERLSHEQFFHPLDRLGGWNHLYGPRGFYQHQSVIPRAAGGEPIRELLRTLRRRGGASFVTVLKALGPLASPGLMSFPQEGLTLALDLPNGGRPTLELLETLDQIVVDAGGRLYPAKDARMSPATFRAGYPQWETFARFIDPAFSSSFWRRVTAS